jgi:hypothetical protein
MGSGLAQSLVGASLRQGVVQVAIQWDLVRSAGDVALMGGLELDPRRV